MTSVIDPNASNTQPPMPYGCDINYLTYGDDDDTTGSHALNWTTGTVQCSHAQLTTIPPLPTNALYL